MLWSQPKLNKPGISYHTYRDGLHIEQTAGRQLQSESLILLARHAVL